eukprot:COSAG06_NODE_25770_length_629_cov_0.679245_1_plen_105_part_10
MLLVFSGALGEIEERKREIDETSGAGVSRKTSNGLCRGAEPNRNENGHQIVTMLMMTTTMMMWQRALARPRQECHEYSLSIASAKLRFPSPFFYGRVRSYSRTRS